MECRDFKSVDASHSSDESTEDGNFKCNICFELAQNPVVTLCGHLYCWPCLYQWLQLHSYSLECPVCKAIIEEENLVPIYGRGKSEGKSDSRTCQTPDLDIPDRPVARRPPTAPRAEVNYFRQDELGTMASSRFGNLTVSALLGILPAYLTWQVNGIHDATVYGSTSGVPYVFSSSFHGGYAHGFLHHHSPQAEGKQFLKILALLMGSLAILFLIFLML